MLSPLTEAILLSAAAGLSVPLGGALALSRRVGRVMTRRLQHGITAFGGGALMSAVALVLVPEGTGHFGVAASTALFCAGGATFFAVDRAMARRGGSLAMLIALLLDYLPEAAALGAILTVNPGTAALLAGLIFLQNVPEGYAALREIRSTHGRPSPGRLLALTVALAALGPACAAIGALALSDRPAVLGAIMLYAAGGILYLVFEDVAPAARVRGDPVPPLGAVAGFALGLAGHLATQ